MKKEESFSSKSLDIFFRDVFQNYLTNKTHIDTKINWLLGVSAIVMSLSIQYLPKEEMILYRLGILFILVGSFLSFIINLLNLDLPDFMTRSIPAAGHNVMFHRNFKNKTVEEITEELKTIKNQEDIVNQYAINIYNLTNRNINFKNRYFKIARNTMLISIIIGVIFILFSL
jgi:hypothetical protein